MEPLQRQHQLAPAPDHLCWARLRCAVATPTAQPRLQPLVLQWLRLRYPHQGRLWLRKQLLQCWLLLLLPLLLLLR